MIRDIDAYGRYSSRMGSRQDIKNRVNSQKYTKDAVSDGPSALEQKIQELKQNPNFSSWPDDALNDYAASLLSNYNATINDINLQSNNKLGHPLDAKWSQYTYEEILQMEDNGVVIPEEFLEWAHSMQSSNTVEYELDTGDVVDENDADGLRADIGDAGNMGMKNVAKVFAKQTQLQEEQINKAIQDFEPLSAELEAVNSEAESIQNSAMKKIESYMNDFKVLDKKVQQGQELTVDEKARYSQLSGVMSAEINSCNVKIEDLTVNFDEIAKEMTSTVNLAKNAQDYADDTNFIGGLIANYEAKHDSAPIAANNHIFDGSAGLVNLLKTNSVGKDLAKSVTVSANKLKTTTFDVDQNIKTISNQMQTVAATAFDGVSNMSAAVNSGNAQKDTKVMPKKSDQKQQEADTKKAELEENTNDILNNEIPPTPGNIIDDTPLISENKVAAMPLEDNEPQQEPQDNVFVQNEDLNDINTILKKSLKAPQTPEATETIVS